MLGHAKATDHPGAPGPWRGKPRGQICMKQEALNQFRPILFAMPSRALQSPGSGRRRLPPRHSQGRPAWQSTSTRRPSSPKAMATGAHRLRSSRVARLTRARSAPPISRSVITKAMRTGRSGQGLATASGKAAFQRLHGESGSQQAWLRWRTRGADSVPSRLPDHSPTPWDDSLHGFRDQVVPSPILEKTAGLVAPLPRSSRREPGLFFPGPRRHDGSWRT